MALILCEWNGCVHRTVQLESKVRHENCAKWLFFEGAYNSQLVVKYTKWGDHGEKSDAKIKTYGEKILRGRSTYGRLEEVVGASWE